MEERERRREEEKGREEWRGEKGLQTWVSTLGVCDGSSNERASPFGGFFFGLDVELMNEYTHHYTHTYIHTHTYIPSFLYTYIRIYIRTCTHAVFFARSLSKVMTNRFVRTRTAISALRNTANRLTRYSSLWYS